MFQLPKTTGEVLISILGTVVFGFLVCIGWQIAEWVGHKF